MDGKIEQSAADTLLDRGIPITVVAPFFLRWLGKKVIHPKIKRPRYGTSLRVSSYYASSGIQLKELENLSIEKAHALFAKHGKMVSKIIASSLINSWVLGWLFTGPLASYLRWNCSSLEMLDRVNFLIILGDARSFISTIRSAHDLTITAPNMSQPAQGS